MSETVTTGLLTVFPQPIEIRFDGLEADRHVLDMADLAESLRGLSRIIGSAADFEVTGKPHLHRDAFAVRVVVAPPEARCFTLLATLHWVDQNPLISTVVGGLTVALICYIFSKAAGNREEMKQLRGALDTAIQQLGSRDRPTVDRLLATIDKLADSLRPAVRQAVHPVGNSASTLQVTGSASDFRTVIGEAEKAAILSEPDLEIGQEKTYRVLINELDMENGSCKVALFDAGDQRYQGKIIDPAFSIANNPYAVAMASKQWISVRAKAMTRDGEIERLFISDAVAS